MANSDVRSYLTQAQSAIASAIAALPADSTVPPPVPPIHVTAGQNLQTALDAAAISGQNIVIDDPGTYVGGILRGRDPNSAPIDITQSVTPPMPAGTRIATAPPVFIAPVAGTNTNIATAKGAHGYVFRGLGFSSPGIYGQMIALETGATTDADFPDTIAIQGCWLDGGNACKRGIQGNAKNLVVMDSKIFGVMKIGQDTQAIGIATGPGPFLIQNNYLSAGSETMIVGGDDPLIQGLIPSNGIVRGNYFTKDMAWITTKQVAKNAFELKNADNWIIEHNIFENSWIDEQSGWLIQFTVRNQGGKAPWSTVSNIEFGFNVCRRGYCGINLLGLDDDTPKDSTVVYPSVRMNNINIHDILFYDLGRADFGSGTKFGIGLNNGINNLTMKNLTMLGPVSEMLALTLGKSNTPSNNAQILNSIFFEGNYGIMSSALTTPGTASWQAGVDAASVFDYNMIIAGGVRKIPYPGANTKVVPTMPMTLPFTPPAMLGNDGNQVGVDIAKLQSLIPEFTF